MGLEHGIIGNCKTACLVSKGGSIDWCSFPRFDSPSVFAKLLDEGKGGSFGFQLVGEYRVKQQYIKDTAVLETAFYNDKNRFRIVDYFLRFRKHRKIVKEDKIYRIIEVLKGNPVVRVIYDPKLDYARGRTRLYLRDKAIIATNKKEKLYLYSNLNLKDILRRKPVELPRKSYFVLSYNEECEPQSMSDVYRGLNMTLSYWYRFVERGTWPSLGKSAVIRSAVTLKLLTYTDSGAIVAAATTSIPEIIGSNRTWDYRFCWLRDSSFTINSLSRICHFDEARDYMRYLKRIALSCDISKKNWDLDMQIMYGIRGERVLREKILRHLSGYKNSRPVRVGNAAYKQKQIDTAGEVIDAIQAFYCNYRYVRKLDYQTWQLIEHLVNYVIDEWKKKDHGIWEFRRTKEHFTFSKLLSWVALDRAVGIAKTFNKKPDLRKWERVRDQIKTSILANGYNAKKKAFTMYYGSDELDASVLLMPYYGFIDATDERMKNTIDAVERELAEGPLVMRYKTADDFGRPRNAFMICSFWLIDALYLSGQRSKARQYFNEVIRYCNGLGLHSEDIEFKTKELTGNFPQAYTHMAMINSAVLLNEKNVRKPKCMG